MESTSQHPPMRTREEIIRAVKALASESGRATVSRREFARTTGISEGNVLRHFASWNELLTYCDLNVASNVKLTDDELMSSMHDVFVESGGITTQRKFRQLSRHSHSIYSRRWGTWENNLLALKDWLKTNDPNSPVLDGLAQIKRESSAFNKEDNAPDTITFARHGAKIGTQYGDFISFRGLIHAPVNEQGVVFLFGMVALELGYIVESIRTGYPDCEAKRRIHANRWQKVHIEFEFESRNFRDHGHDPSKCDVIVCWNHNWLDCPTRF